MWLDALRARSADCWIVDQTLSCYISRQARLRELKLNDRNSIIDRHCYYSTSSDCHFSAPYEVLRDQLRLLLCRCSCLDHLCHWPIRLHPHYHKLQSCHLWELGQLSGTREPKGDCSPLQSRFRRLRPSRLALFPVRRHPDYFVPIWMFRIL